MEVFKVLPKSLLDNIIFAELLFFFIGKEERCFDQLKHVGKLVVQTDNGLHLIKLAGLCICGKWTRQLEIERFPRQLPRQELRSLQVVTDFVMQIDGFRMIVDVVVLLALELDVKIGPGH